MAFEPIDPQRRDLEERRLAAERQYPRRSGGAGWWWVLWVVIIAAIIWAVGWGWGGWWGGRRTTTATNVPAINGNISPNSPTTGDVAVIIAPDKSAYVGKHIALDNAHVQKVHGDKAFWVGNSDNEKVLVIATAAALPQGESDSNAAANGKNNNQNPMLNSGQVVSVSGTMEKAPSQDQAQQQLGLNQDEAKELQKSGAYLRADNVQVLALSGNSAGQGGPENNQAAAPQTGNSENGKSPQKNDQQRHPKPRH